MRQQSSPAALGGSAATYMDKEKQFRRLVLELKKTDGVARNWKDIGRYLDVSDSDIDSIEATTSDIGEKFYQIIRKWKETKKEGDAVYNELADALQQVGLRNAAEIVTKYI